MISINSPPPHEEEKYVVNIEQRDAHSQKAIKLSKAEQNLKKYTSTSERGKF